MGDRKKTPEFRMSYPHLFEKADMSEKYEVKCLFPEGTDLSELKALARATAIEEWGDKIPAKMKSPFLKIDHDETPEYEGFDILINVRSGKRVAVFDSNVERIIDPEDIYGGCWGYAYVTCRAYDGRGPNVKKKFTPGLIFDLVKIQKSRDDDPFGDSEVDDTEDGFDSIDGGAKATKTTDDTEDSWLD